ncbi:hypothetical protein [Microbacterium sp. cf332]|uniref:hypothetical protein n=1 Tax=Microbacterium sp. cf332 TaxID=1761804 RepID=UPI00088AF6CA|nr:hypothetical protein [Microbacterium sp. cf332]SDQ64019.1 hypothetical protein SAMN04487847_2187 [Microbacterium sp. cf332]
MNARRPRARLRARTAAVVVVGCVAAGWLAAPAVTDAAWADREVAAGALSAVTVTSPGAVRCVQSGLAVPAIVGWNAAPTGGNIAGYRWTLAGASNRSGTLPASATSLTLTANTIELGSSTFTLYAVGPGGWERAATTSATVGFISIAVGVTSSCTVP